ncbi:hypothetical protein Glove_529g52 [Diversispora epigaea]|uniref:C2H2-type domain-containing protein n=1 Tax=Diversispora epigaea TaxID=1348612 RepID=A0A397GH14_9GLOM|nr:hypothetical protein Glove_529g52 [Diversispora epigaea]
MPKHEFLTPKAIANRIKSKGLQKLKWYCQMCQKQCRDENGYQCHIRSESHLRQMDLLKENPSMYMQGYSKQFHEDFVKLLSRRWGTKRVHANLVYQEYISDRNHTHMNGTIWETLTDYVKYLGKEGICHADETPKGWFVSWIDNSPKALARQEAILKKERAERDEQERTRKLIEEQIERAKKEAEDLGLEETKFTELKRDNEDDKIKLNISSTTSTSTSTNKTDVSVTPPSTTISNTNTNGSTTTHTSISFNKPTSQKISLSALVKKSNSLSAQKKDKEKEKVKEQPKKVSAMEQIILDEMEKKKRLENLNGNKTEFKRKEEQRNRERDYKNRDDKNRDDKNRDDKSRDDKNRDDKDNNRRDYRERDRNDRERGERDRNDREKERNYREKDREKDREYRERNRDRIYERESKRLRRD